MLCFLSEDYCIHIHRPVYWSASATKGLLKNISFTSLTSRRKESHLSMPTHVFIKTPSRFKSSKNFNLFHQPVWKQTFVLRTKQVLEAKPDNQHSVLQDTPKSGVEMALLGDISEKVLLVTQFPQSPCRRVSGTGVVGAQSSKSHLWRFHKHVHFNMLLKTLLSQNTMVGKIGVKCTYKMQCVKFQGVIVLKTHSEIYGTRCFSKGLLI